MVSWYWLILALLIGVVIGDEIRSRLIMKYMDDLGYPKGPYKKGK